MELLRKGSRLSIQPVSEAEWNTVLTLAGITPARKKKTTRKK
jgi:predicted RNA-binding protein with PUA-like domain